MLEKRRLEREARKKVERRREDKNAEEEKGEEKRLHRDRQAHVCNSWCEHCRDQAEYVD